MSGRTPFIIPKKDAKKILTEALNLSYKHHVDELDCSVSWARIRSKMTFDDVLDIGLNDQHTLYHFIYRDMSFLPQNYKEDGKNPNRNYWDVGLSTISLKKDYFIFIFLEEEDGFALAEKYNLKLRKQ